jgi:hypothetical protein
MCLCVMCWWEHNSRDGESENKSKQRACKTEASCARVWLHATEWQRTEQLKCSAPAERGPDGQ